MIKLVLMSLESTNTDYPIEFAMIGVEEVVAENRQSFEGDIRQTQ